MKKKATAEQIAAVLKRITESGLEPLLTEGENRKVIGIKGDLSTYDTNSFHMTGIENIKRISRPYKLVSKEFQPNDTIIELNGVKIGGNNPPVIIAGPCAIEEYKGKNGPEWMIDIAKAVKNAGADLLRGGAFKPRSNPYSFQGLGEEGLKYLLEAEKVTGLPTVSEATGENQVVTVGEYAAVIQIGTRNAKSYELLKRAGEKTNSSGKAVLLKRGESATLKEFLQAAEYIAHGGCTNIMLCLRGIRTFENKENGFKRYTADLDSISILKRESHLPVIFDPSHASGDKAYIKELSKAAIALGADGLMIEAHLDPDNAWCDAPQQITPKTLSEIIKDVRTLYTLNKQYEFSGKGDELSGIRHQIDKVDYELMVTLSKRNELISQVAEYKKDKGLSVFHPKREAQLLAERKQLAGELGIDPVAIERIFHILLEYSHSVQHRILTKK